MANYQKSADNESVWGKSTETFVVMNRGDSQQCTAESLKHMGKHDMHLDVQIRDITQATSSHSNQLQTEALCTVVLSAGSTYADDF